MKKKPKNDNLKKHQTALVERNTALVKRAIEHIKRVDGEISMSIVSKVTYEIADRENGEKGVVKCNRNNRTYTRYAS